MAGSGLSTRCVLAPCRRDRRQGRQRRWADLSSSRHGRRAGRSWRDRLRRYSSERGEHHVRRDRRQRRPDAWWRRWRCRRDRDRPWRCSVAGAVAGAPRICAPRRMICQVAWSSPPAAVAVPAMPVAARTWCPRAVRRQRIRFVTRGPKVLRCRRTPGV